MSKQSFELYSNLLVQLHIMIAAGTDETEEGDALREQMDAPWQECDEREQQLLAELSKTLYDSAQEK